MCYRIQSLTAVLILLAVARVTAAPLSGTRSVGPTGDYSSLTAAIADVQAVGNGLGGALVLELQATYVSSVETFPLTIPALDGASAVNTLTIRPATGATALSISSADTTAATVDMNGAQFVIIDGRPGGVGSHGGSGGGSASQLTISNTSTSGVALRFINEAGINIIQYTTLRGVNRSSFSGTVVFSTTTGPNGNDHNTIDHCDIGDGASTPARGIYALGTTTAASQNNSGNTVSHCNVFNFHYMGATGVQLEGGNTDWNITNNSFYQTASRAAVSAPTRAIYINNTSGNNFTVTGNFIGGSAPGAGGAAWTTIEPPSGANVFQGIALNVGASTPSGVHGNTIANIAWATSSVTVTTLPGILSGIYVQAGSVNVGTVAGNTIGSATGTDSISVSDSGGNGSVSFGIGSSSTGTVTIANNSIGSITVRSGGSEAASLTGIQVTDGTCTISNNTVGSITTPNSLNAASSATTGGQKVTGILSSSGGSVSITANTVANLNNNAISTGLTGRISGIVATTGLNTITGNTVSNLSTTIQNPESTNSQSVYGIIVTSALAGQTVSQNTVHSLANTAASAGVKVTGIYFAGPTSGTNVIARNFVHSLAVSSSSALSRVNGMYFAAGAFTAQNNMVRVGLDANGTSTAGAAVVLGIFDRDSTPGRSFFHNSIYVGGAQSSGGNITVAFYSSGFNNTRAYQNNIFMNARGNSGGTGKHYAVIYSGVSVNPNGLTAGGNIFFTSGSGSGGVLGNFNDADHTTLAAWQAATGQDATSKVADPNFINPAGSAATVDLHLPMSNPAEGVGFPIATVTDDFDGQMRSALTPVDIGADAGNFIEIIAPVISYPLLGDGSTTSRVLAGWAAITDNVGVAGGGNAPRLYFKKSTDADVFGVANDATGNGWKHVTATGGGPYVFTLDYSLINGGGVTAGDVIQYFVAAQDAANNLSSSPSGATAAAAPPVQNVNSHGAVNSFAILGTAINGTVTVGNGGAYPSLSGGGGFFAAVDGAVLEGHVVVKIISDLTETGGVPLGEFKTNDYPPRITIEPDSATMRTLSGSVNRGLITLNGADSVIIDGRFGGSGRYLTIRNASTGSAANAIRFMNDAVSNIVRNCVVEGAGSGAYGVIYFGGGRVTGNDNNLITGCQVRDLSTAAAVPQVLILSDGYYFEPYYYTLNSSNTVSNNELFNFAAHGIYIGDTGNESWTISGNEIYQLSPSASSLIAIQMSGSGDNVIDGNSIRDLLTTGTSSKFIRFTGSGTTTISRNRIIARDVNAATSIVKGIGAYGIAGSTLNVVNNQITLRSATPVSSSLYGIQDDAGSGSVINVFHNSVVIGGTENGTRNSWASYRNTSSTHTARNNLFLNLRTGGSGSHFAAARQGNNGTYTVSHNVYAGTGATPAFFMDLDGGYGTAAPKSFAVWQSATGDTNSQAAIAGSGHFTSAMFVDAANGDLHLVPGGNLLVNALGTPIPGVTDDFDGNPRQAGAPTIGADEFVPLNAQEAWRQTWFGISSNTGNAADTFDFDRDGLVNLVEFALGLNPTQNSAGQLPSGQMSGGNFVITFIQPAGVSGITYSAEWSTTLSNNPLDWTAITDSDPSATGYTFSVPAGSHAQLFMRLKVMSP